MSRDVTTIGPTASVSEALRVLLQHKYGCLPVVEYGNLVGLITAVVSRPPLRFLRT